MDRSAVERWIRAHVDPVGPIETAHERPWATVLRVPLANSIVWFKACAPVQAFEPRLTGELFARWPDRVGEVLGQDNERGWLLVADAGTPMHVLGNPPGAWLRALPLYAELQRGETAYADDHLAHGVPDLRVATWSARYGDLLQRDLPLNQEEIRRLREFTPRFSELCAELAAHAVADTIQHDDLHMEPWGSGLADAFALAIRTGTFALAFAWTRQRDALPDQARPEFDQEFSVVLRRAIAQTPDRGVC